MPRFRRHEVPDIRQGRAHERVHALVVGKGGLAHRRPEPQSTVRRDGIEPSAVQVDEQARPHEAHRERGHEALPARDRLRVLPALGERRERMLERFGANIVERGGLQADPSACSRLLQGRWSNSHTRGPVSGSSTSSRSSASATALAIAAGADMVLPSPSPFAPSAVNGEGDDRWSIRSAGTSGAVGVR